MNDIEEKLMNSLNGLLENNIEAINVRIFGTKARKSVQIIIESDDGITVESCSSVTRIAQNIIKLENLIDHDYNIEVSSPGINRPLFNLRDFIKFQGEKINVELKRKINDKKRFTGAYSVINENIVFLNDDDTTKISIEDIKKANLIREIKV